MAAAGTDRLDVLVSNAVCPGYCATGLTGHAGPRTAAEGATIAVAMATLDDDGPTGGCHADAGAVDW